MNKVLFRIKSLEVKIKHLLLLLLLLLLFILFLCITSQKSKKDEAKQDKVTEHADKDKKGTDTNTDKDKDKDKEDDEDSNQTGDDSTNQSEDGVSSESRTTPTEDICTINDVTIIKLEKLIIRSDLCSETWFQDLDAYITELQTEIQTLASKSGLKDKQLKAMEENIYEAVLDFKDKQGEKEINQLQQAIQDYNGYYRKNCK